MNTLTFRRLVKPGAAVLLLLMLALLGVRPLQAAGISVDRLDDTQADDGGCTLREAIINANNDDQSGSIDCAAGSGADTITFSQSGTIALSSPCRRSSVM